MRSSGTSASVSSGSENGYRRLPALDSELPPYPDAPEDPWVAVNGDQPRRMKQSDADLFGIRQNATTKCTAARDHCLPTQTWFIAKASYDREMHAADVLPAILGTESPISPANTDSRLPYPEKYIAFRTVPATRDNLVPGAIVIGQGHGYVSSTAAESWQSSWVIGRLASVDYNTGMCKLETANGVDNDEYPLTFARVAVLRWEPGGTVKIVGDRPRDKLAVKASDVFMPRSM
jgi:hypothetical protein